MLTFALTGEGSYVGVLLGYALAMALTQDNALEELKKVVEMIVKGFQFYLVICL